MGKEGLKSKKEKEKERLTRLEEEKVRLFLAQKYEDDAKNKWVEELLLPIDDFTLQDYEEIMADPEEVEEAAERRHERDDRVKKLFESFLTEKEERLAKAWTWLRVKRGMRRALLATAKGVEYAAQEVGKLLEPYDSRVERKMAASLNKIASADRELLQWLHDREQTLQMHDQHVQDEKLLTRKRKVVLEVQQATTGFIKADEKRIADEARKQRVEQYQAQRRAEAEARAKARRDEEEAERKALEDEVNRVRKWRMKHWAQKAVEFRQEGNQVQEDFIKAEEERILKAIKRDEDEDQHREKMRVEEQVVAPITSEDTVLASGERLGVYGWPYSRGEHEPGVDDHEVGLFQPTSQVSHEVKRRPIYESQAHESRRRLLYEQLQNEGRMLSSEIDNLKETKVRLEVDMEQMQQETNDLDHRLEKPLQRYPTPDEKKEIHFRKPRMRALSERIAKMSANIVNLEDRKKEVQKQSLSLAKELAILREKNKGMAEALDKEENVEDGGRMSDLPVVIGEHISKMAGVGNFRSRPQQSYDLVVQQSKLELYKDQSKAVLNALREGHDYGLKVWAGGEEKRVGTIMLEEMLSRLKGAQDKVSNLASTP